MDQREYMRRAGFIMPTQAEFEKYNKYEKDQYRKDYWDFMIKNGNHRTTTNYNTGEVEDEYDLIENESMRRFRIISSQKLKRDERIKQRKWKEEENKKKDIKITDEDMNDWESYEFKDTKVESHPGWQTISAKKSEFKYVKFRFEGKWFAVRVNKKLDMKQHIHNKDLIIKSGYVGPTLYNKNCFMACNVVFGEKRPRKKKISKKAK